MTKKQRSDLFIKGLLIFAALYFGLHTIRFLATV